MFKRLSRFFYILANKRSIFFLISFLFLLASILEAVGISLIGPYMSLATSSNAASSNSILQWAYERLGINSHTNAIALLGAFIIVIFYTKSLAYFYIKKYIFLFSFNHLKRIQIKLMHAYLYAPYVFHLNRNSALMIQNIAVEARQFCLGFMLPLLTAFTNLIVLFVLVLLLTVTNVLATISISGILLTAFLLYFRFRYKITAWGKQASESLTGIIGTVNHGLGGLKETKVIGCEQYFEDQIITHSQNHSVALANFNIFKFVPRLIIEALLITFLVGFTSASIFLSFSSQNLTATLGVFAVASIRLIPTVSQLMSSISIVRNNFFPLDKIYMDLKELEKNEKTSGKLNFEDNTTKPLIKDDLKLKHKVLPFTKEISLNNLVYSYPSSSEISLNGISLSIKKGQSVAFIGKSGSGKTTLVDIILGLLTPAIGSITVDGISVYENIRSWQNLIGYIPQSIFLMDDTIARNIAFGVPDNLIELDKVFSALQAAQLSDLIQDLPDGLQTCIGEQSVRLSGGQRQRLGIARALYHEREILVLDEATASLDNETEYLVNQAIQSLGSAKTLIIIAHRLTTVEHCDCIYELKKGKIVRSGSYNEVVLNPIKTSL